MLSPRRESRPVSEVMTGFVRKCNMCKIRYHEIVYVSDIVGIGLSL